MKRRPFLTVGLVVGGLVSAVIGVAHPPAAVAGVGSGVTVADGTGDSSVGTATDIKSVSLVHDTIGLDHSLKATMVVDGSLPPDGSMTLPGGGWPTHMRFLTLYNNRDKAHNGDNTATGCAAIPTGRIRDQRSHWADGTYDFVALEIAFDGVHWQHRPLAGWYEPTEEGSYRLIDLQSEPDMAGRYTFTVSPVAGDTQIEVEVSGIVREANPLCIGGVFLRDLASTNPGPYSSFSYVGDAIANVFGLTTASMALPPPSKPGNPRSDFGIEPYEPVTPTFVDWTTRTSGATVVVNTLAPLDTDGKGPTCPTETYGGVIPSNVLWAANQNQPCEIDDDGFGNPVNREFRTSGYSFVF